MVELTLEVRQAIRQAARRIVSTESACIEWGASAERSVELAEQEITKLVESLIYTSRLELELGPKSGWSAEEMLDQIRGSLKSRADGINAGGDIEVMEAVDRIVTRESGHEG